jgi:hypothetical protein
MGEPQRLAADELAAELKKFQSLDDNQATLQRTLAHLAKNGVDTSRDFLSLGALLEFDPEKETFTNNSDANALLTREYRAPYICPTADRV